MRRAVHLVALALALAACGDGAGSAFTNNAPTTEPTGASTVTTTAAATTPPAEGTTALPPGQPTVWAILQRWDGSRPLGSFEATVCNLGFGPAAGLEAVIAANGVEVRVPLPEVPPRDCVDAHDPASTFETFGVGLGQTVAVRAALRRDGTEIDVREEAITVDLMSPEPTAAVMEHYTWCLEHNEPVHGLCVPLSARAAFADPPEVMKQWGRYVVVTPAGWEPLAAMTLADLAICLPRLEEYLGIPLPRHANPLVWRYSESAGYSWFGAAEGIQHIVPTQSGFYEGVRNGQFPQHSWDSIFRGLCSEAHETTHVLVDQFKGLPNWLNEGLAVFMSSPERCNWYFPQPTFHCDAAGYYDVNGTTGEETFVPYAALEPDPAPGADFGPYYATGACFWVYFESTYGHEAFLRVMDALEATREAPGDPWAGCPAFLELVTAIIGEDLAPLTQERFGFGPEYSVCKLGG